MIGSPETLVDARSEQGPNGFKLIKRLLTSTGRDIPGR